MEFIDHNIIVKTPKEISEVLENLVELITECKKALSDGKVSGGEYSKIGIELVELLSELTDYEEIQKEVASQDHVIALANVYGIKLVKALMA